MKRKSIPRTNSATPKGVVRKSERADGSGPKRRVKSEQPCRDPTRFREPNPFGIWKLALAKFS
eukprot:2481593-Pyramimonas_sp.AAC.1